MEPKLRPMESGRHSNVREVMRDLLIASADNPDAVVSSAETDCYRVDASGNATLVAVTITGNGTTLAFE